MGVEVATIDQKFDATLKPATQFAFELNHPKAAGALAASDVYSWKEVTKIWKSGKPAYRDPASGDFFAAAGTGRKSLAPPRIGIYKSFVPSMDEGWTRWLLEDFGFGYANIENGDVQAGNLKQRFDAIVIPDQPRQQIAQGHRAGSMPPEYCGGLGEKGAAALKEFVEQGGTLIFFNHASDYATQDLGVKARNVLRGVESKEFYSPGSLLNVSLDPKSPLAYGMPGEITLWSEGSPTWEAPAEQVVARYPSHGVLASGWLLGEKYLTEKAALLDVPLGSGRVILFGMRPQYRAQSYQNFKLFFNALVYH
jgi:hypothetical protein